MRIIIDIDGEVWGNAFLDWDEKNETHQKWAAHTRVVNKRLLAALAMETERVRFIEEDYPDNDEFDSEGDGE